MLFLNRNLDNEPINNIMEIIYGRHDYNNSYDGKAK